jgi:NAD(P)-dependent dehydrogenase (short-subunit alcohol dehydrogenase family)
MLAVALVSALSLVQPPAATRRAVLIGAGAAATTLPSAAFAFETVYKPKKGSLKGETVLITGANTGLGLESAKRLAAAGASIVLTARSKAKADAAAAEVRAETGAKDVVGVELDLASLVSVASLPSRLDAALGADAPIDCLLNNAGVMAIPERLSTADGFERTIGVNHLGHFALVAAVLPALKRAKKGFRVVNVSSDAHRFVTASALDDALAADLDPSEYSAWGAYGLSKAYNILFTVELQARLEAAGVQGSAVALHPGVVQTDLARYIIGGAEAGDVRLSETADEPTGVARFLKVNVLDKLILPVQKGANTQVFLAAAADTSGDLAKRTPGVYYDVMKPVSPTDASVDAAAARKLWEVSERLTKVKIPL